MEYGIPEALRFPVFVVLVPIEKVQTFPALRHGLHGGRRRGL